MENTYITTISMQGAGQLHKVLYHPEGFELQGNIETSFPIIPVIKEHMDEMGRMKIIAVTIENEDVNRNYERFLQELSEIGINEKVVKKVLIREEISKKVQFELMMRLLNEVSEDSHIYMCITYGLKPTSVLMTFMTILLPMLKSNCVIQGLYYGQFPRRNKEGLYDKAKLCDLTELIYLQQKAQQMENMDISDPEAFFLHMLREEAERVRLSNETE